MLIPPLGRGGQSYFKSNGNEALSNEFLLKSNGNEALNAEKKIVAMKRLMLLKN
jgi:hypothetical protein